MSGTGINRTGDAPERLGELAVRYMDGTLDEAGETELKEILTRTGELLPDIEEYADRDVLQKIDQLEEKME